MSAAALERAENLRLMGRFDDAERTLRDALGASPDDPDLLGELAWVLQLADRPAERLAAADAATARAPQDGRLHQIRAALLSALSRHDEAVQAASAARSLRPQDPAPACPRARARRRRPVARGRRCRAASRRARSRVLGGTFHARRHLRRPRRSADRAPAYKEALRLQPQNAVARHDLAVLDANTLHPVRALRGLVEAGALGPTLPLVMRTIAAVLWKLSWRLRMLFVVATVACVAASGPEPEEPPWATLIAAAGALPVIGLLVWWTARDLPARTRPAVRAALRTDGPLRFTYLAIAACVLLFLTVAVTGLGVFAGFVWLVLGLLGVLALAVRLVRRLRGT